MRQGFLFEHAGEPLRRGVLCHNRKIKGIVRPVLFGTAIALIQPRLFGLEVLGEGGWLKTLRLADYAPRRGVRDRFSRACYPITRPGAEPRPPVGACPSRPLAAAGAHRGTTAMASISTRKSGFANPAT